MVPSGVTCGNVPGELRLPGELGARGVRWGEPWLCRLPSVTSRLCSGSKNRNVPRWLHGAGD